MIVILVCLVVALGLIGVAYKKGWSDAQEMAKYEGEQETHGWDSGD